MRFKNKKVFTLYILIIISLSGCGVLKEKPADPTLDFLKRPLTQEESEKLASEVGGNFIYGQGLGEALLNIGGIILWPPYAVYVLGNGAISLSGYEPLYVTNLLPETAKDSYDTGYVAVTSAPGKLSAAISQEEFRNQEVIKKRYKDILSQSEDSKIEKN
jgi:hypothetical protein